MSIVQIPRTPERCVDVLAEAGALITAKEWHRAAIVAALVGPPAGAGRKELSSSEQFLTLTDLAGKGIIGLESRTTVERYRNAWCKVRPVPELGAKVDLDGLPDWPPPPSRHVGNVRTEAIEAQARLDGVGPRAATSVAASPKAMAAAIKADPATAEAAAAALRETRDKPTPAAAPERPHVWTILTEARTVIADLERLVAHMAGATFAPDVRDALREAHARLSRDVDMFAACIESEALSDDALHEWMQG